MTRKTNARLAGFMFLFYIATGIGEMVLFAPATTGASTPEKLASVVRHATLVRAESISAIVMFLNAVVLGVALYGLTREHDHEVALLALLCRFAEGSVAIASAFVTRALLIVATSAAGARGAEAAAATALGSVLLGISPFMPLLAATTFAIGSTLFCILFVRARTVPVVLSGFGVLASILLLIGLPLQMAGLMGGTVTVLMWIPMAVFEVTFALWLLIKGA